MHPMHPMHPMQPRHRRRIVASLLCGVALFLGSCTSPSDAISSTSDGPDECTVVGRRGLSDPDRRDQADALVQRIRSRRDPAAVALGRIMDDFALELRVQSRGERLTPGAYARSVEKALTASGIGKGIEPQVARARARALLIQGLEAAARFPGGMHPDAVRMADSISRLPGVQRAKADLLTSPERSGQHRGIAKLFTSTTDTVALRNAVFDLAEAVGDTSKLGVNALAQSASVHSSLAQDWESDTLRARQLTDAHAVLDTLRLVVDDLVFAAWLADTTSLTPIWRTVGSCQKGEDLFAAAVRAESCPPCIAAGLMIAAGRVILPMAASAGVGVAWELVTGVVSGDGGTAADIAEAGAEGAAQGAFAMGLYHIFTGQTASAFGWIGLAASLGIYLTQGAGP